MSPVTQFSIGTIVLLIIPAVAFAMCQYEDHKLLETDFGKIKYCAYKDVEIEVGGRFRDIHDCMIVRCTRKALVKCGYGKKLGIMFPPPGCKIALNGCYTKVVQDEETDTKCPAISK